MRPNPQKTALLVTFTEEMLNGKLYFLYSVRFCLNLFFSRRNIARYLDSLLLLTSFRPFVKRLFWQETFQYKFKSPNYHATAISNTNNSLSILKRYIGFIAQYIWDKLFKSGPSNICGTQPLKN